MNWADLRPRVEALPVRIAVVGAALALALAGCAGAGPGTPSDGLASVSVSAEPRVASTPSPAGGDPARAPLVVEPGLLAILPASVGGVPVTAVSETALNMAADPSLGTSASGIAVGLAVAPLDSGGDDVAIATVVRLRPGVYSDGFFEGWRRAYDDAACAPAGGVSSHVNQVIDLKPVMVTVCAQGARAYHVHLASDIIVSVTAVGDRNFGDLMMAGLRE